MDIDNKEATENCEDCTAPISSTAQLTFTNPDSIIFVSKVPPTIVVFGLTVYVGLETGLQGTATANMPDDNARL